jgi:hypothetical protein
MRAEYVFKEPRKDAISKRPFKVKGKAGNNNTNKQQIRLYPEKPERI